MQIQAQAEGEALRRVMRRVPSPVVIVTAFAGEARGATIGSFTSVSLDPPLISFNLARQSRIHDAVSQAERFAVHVLDEEQAELYQRFAIADLTGTEQFDGIIHHIETDGLPVLRDAAVIFCRRSAVYPAGDHSIILGAVESISDQGAVTPVVYYNRSYRQVGEVVVSSPQVTTNLASSESPIAPAPKSA